MNFSLLVGCPLLTCMVFNLHLETQSFVSPFGYLTAIEINAGYPSLVSLFLSI